MDVYDAAYLLEDDGSSVSSDEGQWAYEGIRGPISEEKLLDLQAVSPEGVAALYWAMRKAIRRFRAASGTFGHRQRLRVGKAGGVSLGKALAPGEETPDDGSM